MSELKKDFWVNDETPLNAENLNAMTNRIVDNSKKIEDIESGKQDKIDGTPNKITCFDANGKVVASDISTSEVVTTDILEEGLSSKSNKVNNSTAYSLVCFGDTDGTLVESEISESNVITTYNLADNVIDKADKVTGATSGHLASLNGDGNLVDSGIHKDVINELSTELEGKQDKLTAGTGIKIENNVISTTNSGGGGGPVDSHYSATSPNAQSGTAVAEAIETVKLTAGNGINITNNKISVSTEHIVGSKSHRSYISIDDIYPISHPMRISLTPSNYYETYNGPQKELPYLWYKYYMVDSPLTTPNDGGDFYSLALSSGLIEASIQISPEYFSTGYGLYVMTDGIWTPKGGSEEYFKVYNIETPTNPTDYSNEWRLYISLAEGCWYVVLQCHDENQQWAQYEDSKIELYHTPLNVFFGSSNVDNCTIVSNQRGDINLTGGTLYIEGTTPEGKILTHQYSDLKTHMNVNSISSMSQTIKLSGTIADMSVSYVKNINKELNITPTGDPDKQLLLVESSIGRHTDESGEIFSTYEDKTYSFSQYPQYNAKVLNSSSANRENGQAYKNKSISEKTTTSGSSNISGCKAFKIIGHSDVRGLNGGAGHYYINKNSESDKLFNDYCNEATKTKELYGCYSTWLFTNTGGNNRAEMVESSITITPEGSSYKIVVSNFTNLESVKSNFADNVSYIRFYEKYEQSVGNNQTRFIPMPLVELGDTSIEGWSYAGGLNNKAVGLGSFVTGNQNVADGAYSFVAGRQNVGGFTSFVTGRWNKVGQYGAAFGQLNEVSAINGLSAGTRNKIKGKSSGAFGEFNKINSENSIGTGYENHINGNNAIAGGIHNTLIGKNSGALGENNVINGENTLVSGKNNNTYIDNQLAAGQYNVGYDKLTINNFSTVGGDGGYYVLNNKGFTPGNELKVKVTKGNGGHTLQFNKQNKTGETDYLKKYPDTKYCLRMKVKASCECQPSFKIYHGAQLDSNNQKVGKRQLKEVTPTLNTKYKDVTFEFTTPKDSADTGNIDRTHLFLQIYSATSSFTVTIESIELLCYNKLFTLGNGLDESNRNDAFAVYKDGHAEVDTIGNTDKSIVTKKYVEDNYSTKDYVDGKINILASEDMSLMSNEIRIYVGTDRPSGDSFPLGSLWIKPVE